MSDDFVYIDHALYHYTAQLHLYLIYELASLLANLVFNVFLVMPPQLGTEGNSVWLVFTDIMRVNALIMQIIHCVIVNFVINLLIV